MNANVKMRSRQDDFNFNVILLFLNLYQPGIDRIPRLREFF